MSAFLTTFVAIPLAALLSFVFYKFGLGIGKGMPELVLSTSVTIKPEQSKSLRSNNTRPSIPSLISGLNLDPSIYGNIPACARDVFVTLHKEDGGEDEETCKGLLIRDDIIITSKECSKLDFNFKFAGYGIVKAIPHASLNAKEGMADSRLGFLEAHPPYHLHFVDQPVRRARMFLSDHSNPKINATEVWKSPVLTCGSRGEPIAHNFPLNHAEMIPLAELAGIVPRDVLWEDKDLKTTPMLKHESQRWWARPITLQKELSRMKIMTEQHRGPPGSVSLPDAQSSIFMKRAALGEAVDPRGHRRGIVCIVEYQQAWRNEKPFSGMHYFDWLDFGPGKVQFSKSSSCRYEHFNEWTVHYFNDTERDEHEIYFKPSENGTQLIARYKHNDELVPTSCHGDNCEWDHPHLYMWDLNKKWYVVDDSWDEWEYGAIKHSAVVAGKPALSGGKAYFGEGGAVWGINYSSGHYRPNIHSATMMYQWMKDQGFNLTALHWVGRYPWSSQNCIKTDWKEIKVPGFTAAALNQSCHEMTESPTFEWKEDV